MYSTAEKGRFDVALVYNGAWIAYTDYNCVKVCSENYREKNRKAVEEFAEDYELPIIWDD